jgi:hypothetical protein
MGAIRIGGAKRQTVNTVLALAGTRRGSPRARAIRTGLLCGVLAFTAVVSMPDISMADEGGVSFWLPGLFGSLAAVPQQPGWSLASIYYHTTVSAGGDVARAREITIGRIPANLTATLNASLNATGDIGLVSPTYVFASPVLGGQASVSVPALYGTTSASLATLQRRSTKKHKRHECRGATEPRAIEQDDLAGSVKHPAHVT